MDQKRYQVFISSTFKDLSHERVILTQTLLKKDCIPVGMEWFPAIDEEQFEYIKKIIYDSDYYVLILGGMYGSLASDGISYTEKEYDYAKSLGKKVIALIRRNPTLKETDNEKIEKYNLFYKKVTDSRLVSFWEKPEDLSIQLAISLDSTIKKYPAQGWTRCEPSICENRLQLIDINKKISTLKFEAVKTIHIMASGTSSYIPLVRQILKSTKRKTKIDIYIYFRLGNDKDRKDTIKKQYSLYWEKLKEFNPKIQYHFIYIQDFHISFRGIVINKEIGLVGFYVRKKDDTLGSMDDLIYVDKHTNVGEYIIKSFLTCFEDKQEFNTLCECIK